MRFVLPLFAGAALWQAVTVPAAAQEPVEMKLAAPELEGIGAWVNSKPLTLKALRGKVVVLHFWAFG